MSLRVEPIPCLVDNYAYLVVCEQTRRAGIVDPSEVEPVLAAVASAGVTLEAIFNTHHHWDHTGGNEGLLEKLPQLRVYGHASDASRIPGITHRLEDGEGFELGELRGRVRHIPGHTTGAIAYLIDAGGRKTVFTGDTLFAAGCGRLFEGTPEMMDQSLNAVLSELADDTEVFFGHEYTEKNLLFALEVEPDNAALTARLEAVRALRARGGYTTPSRIAEEKATNPFMRTHSATLRDTAAGELGRTDPGELSSSEVLGALRALKDRF